MLKMTSQPLIFFFVTLGNYTPVFLHAILNEYLPFRGKMGCATLIAGTGSIRARAHALGSIPLGLASACSHSALVSRGLHAVNTPP